VWVDKNVDIVRRKRIEITVIRARPDKYGRRRLALSHQARLLDGRNDLEPACGELTGKAVYDLPKQRCHQVSFYCGRNYDAQEPLVSRDKFLEG
jgi:hypothetical protein